MDLRNFEFAIACITIPGHAGFLETRFRFSKLLQTGSKRKLNFTLGLFGLVIVPNKVIFNKRSWEKPSFWSIVKRV